MTKGKKHKRKVKDSGVRKPRTPAVIKAYSGSGYHSPGKYGHKERRDADHEIQRELG